MTKKIKWLDEVQEHDYPAAASYLSLIYDSAYVLKKIHALRYDCFNVTFKAKDIFRASGLSLLGISNSHVEKDCRKISAGTALSPLLLVRDGNLGKVVIADGYHRLCAIYSIDEDTEIHCKIA